MFSRADRYDHEGKAWMALAGLSGVVTGAAMPEHAIVFAGVWGVILVANLLLLFVRRQPSPEKGEPDAG